TDELVEQLTALWKDGSMSCSMIGQVMGISRNAVIGKVHRLKLPGRVKSFRPRISKQRERTARQRFRIRPEGGRMPRQVTPTIAPEPVVFTASTWQPIPGIVPVTLADLPAGACKWPVGDLYAPASETRF